MRRKFFVWTAALILLLGGFGCAFTLNSVRASEDVSSADDMQIFWPAWEFIQNRYLEGPVADTTLFYSALRGMLNP